jgi:hypothetical protein
MERDILLFPESRPAHRNLLPQQWARWLRRVLAVLPDSSLAEFRSFHARVVEKNIPIKFVFNHHESFAFYFDDPDGNMIEVYWPTGDLSRKQPYAEPLDLSQPNGVLLEKITATP